MTDKYKSTYTGPKIDLAIKAALEYLTDGSSVSPFIQSSNYVSGSTGWKVGVRGSNDGFAEFSNVTVRGAISAVTIDIGGDDATSFHVDIAGGIWSGAAIADKATAPFRVSNAGALVATSATITGVITANTGKIGGANGWVISAGYLKDVAGVVGLSSVVSGGDDIRFWAGHATPESAPFYVTEAGVIKASSGTIGGWTLGATTLSSASIVIDDGNDRIRSTNYVSGINGAGFTLEPDLLEVGNIAARGIFRTAVFQKDVVNVCGGSLAILDGDCLAEDMTAGD